MLMSASAGWRRRRRWKQRGHDFRPGPRDCGAVKPSSGDRRRAKMKMKMRRGEEMRRGRSGEHCETCGQVPNGARLKKRTAGVRRRKSSPPED